MCLTTSITAVMKRWIVGYNVGIPTRTGTGNSLGTIVRWVVIGGAFSRPFAFMGSPLVYSWSRLLRSKSGATSRLEPRHHLSILYIASILPSARIGSPCHPSLWMPGLSRPSERLEPCEGKLSDGRFLGGLAQVIGSAYPSETLFRLLQAHLILEKPIIIIHCPKPDKLPRTSGY